MIIPIKAKMKPKKSEYLCKLYKDQVFMPIFSVSLLTFSSLLPALYKRAVSLKSFSLLSVKDA
jgi:hypothetical protein